MAGERIRTAALAKVLNLVPQPVYLVDADRTLVFCNQMCLDWVGCSAEDLLGRQCVYRSATEEAGPEAAAAGLCPPPEVSRGREVSATVTAQTAERGLRRRLARFLPLGPADNLVGVLALVDAEDLAELPGQAVAGGPPRAESAQLHEELQAFRSQSRLRYRPERLVGSSPAARRLRAQVAAAAETSAAVLVVGPPGSGRQHVAATIHYAAPAERIGTLVPLACPLLGPELLRSTIDALASAQPAAERALRNTLVLNDVDQVPAAAQPELASALGARGFPFRVIATARRPLLQLAREGACREDLAAVLSTMVIELRPLAEGREDLPLLAQAMVEDLNAQGEKQLSGFTPEALDRLDAYPWPGGLDELAAMVKEAHGRAEGPWIGPDDLPKRIHWAAGAAAHPRRPEETIVLDEFLAKVERELVRRALARSKGNKAKAARLLGLTRPRLYRRMVELGLAEREDNGQSGTDTTDT